MTSSVELDLNPLIEESLRLRVGVSLPTIDQGPVEVLSSLIGIRSRLDRIEEILSIVVRFRGQIQSSFKSATAELEEAWAAQVSSPSRRGRGSTDWNAPAPRERYAEADLATLDLKRRQRQWEHMFDTANVAVDVIQRTHRGLDATRMDLHLILRAMSVETALER